MTFENQGTDHILEILRHLSRIAAKSGDTALSRDLEMLRERAARRKRLVMH